MLLYANIRKLSLAVYTVTMHVPVLSLQWDTPIALDLPVIIPPVSVLGVLVTVDENNVMVM